MSLYRKLRGRVRGIRQPTKGERDAANLIVDQGFQLLGWDYLEERRFSENSENPAGEKRKRLRK